MTDRNKKVFFHTLHVDSQGPPVKPVDLLVVVESMLGSSMTIGAAIRRIKRVAPNAEVWPRRNKKCIAILFDNPLTYWEILFEETEKNT